MDLWGEIFRDHWEGRETPHEVERDDGRRETFESAAPYFEAPRSDAERELLDRLSGPILELGAGPGSYSLYLQGRGLEVTATDASPGALEVCRLRGCEDARVLDLRSPDLEPDAYRAILVMGNTLGAHQTPRDWWRVVVACGTRGRHMPTEVSIARAKATLSAQVRAAERGEPIVITRHGKPVAALVPASDLERLERLRAAGPEGGLASVAGGWEGSDELANWLECHPRTGPRSDPLPE